MTEDCKDCVDIKLLILDIDGVLTNGTKVYDKEHNVLSKSFMCKDFTAIKRFIAAGIKVVLISGDSWNREMARKRNLDFYCTRDVGTLNLDKSLLLDEFKERYKVELDQMVFVGDDFFDLSMFLKLKNTVATADAPGIIRHHCKYHIGLRGGEGCIVALYDLALTLGWINLPEPSMEQVLELDRLEQTSQEMK